MYVYMYVVYVCSSVLCMHACIHILCVCKYSRLYFKKFLQPLHVLDFLGY